MSVDAVAALKDFVAKNAVHHLLLADTESRMLPAYGALVTDPQSPMFRLAKRAYFIIDRKGVVRYAHVMDNPLDFLTPEQLLEILKQKKGG